ncbi:hypothetical protein [Haliangium sp.]|uniref:hypothetical protein n=1 Tax=Haliangium sp. TaxID=2663208 RepID=UPI003D099DA9
MSTSKPPGKKSRLQERAQQLIERGLERYARGEVDAALGDWRHALTLDPRSQEARRHLNQVQRERGFLDEDTPAPASAPAADDSFALESLDSEGARALADDNLDIQDILGLLPDPAPAANADSTPKPQQPVPESRPLPQVAPSTKSSPAVRLGHGAGRVAPGGAKSVPVRASRTVQGPPMPSEPLPAAPTPPTPAAPPAEPAAAAPPIASAPTAMAMEDTQPVQNREDSDNAATQPLTATDCAPAKQEMQNNDTQPVAQERLSSPRLGLAPTVELGAAQTLAMEVDDAQSTQRMDMHMLDDEPPTLPPTPSSSSLPPVVIEDLPPDDDEDRPPSPSPPRTQTAQLFGVAPTLPARRREGLAGVARDISPAAEPTPAPTPAAPARTDLDDPLALALLGELDAAVVPAPDDAKAVRARLDWLLERARSERHAGNHTTALVAVELLYEEAPDDVFTQKLIQRHVDLILDIYKRYEGDPEGVPALAMSPSEYGQRRLGSRAAFLLSRVDGMLTVEELIAIAGMPALEAHRHLCNLLHQGILTLR